MFAVYIASILVDALVLGALGYLTASIKTNGILTNVISTSGQKENNIVTIKIEGDLP